MARKKTVSSQNSTITGQGTLTAALELAELIEEFNGGNPPPAYMMKTGIAHLDAIYGGGFISSGIIAFSSTPETGKSTIAYQVCKSFLDQFPNSIAIYFDVEGAGAVIETTDGSYSFQQSRPETFGLNTDKRFIYNRRPYNLEDFFKFLDKVIENKKQLQTKTGGEVKLLVVIDSISQLTTTKLDAADSFDSVVGARARELTFYLNKFKTSMAFERPIIIAIDQVRAAIKMKSRYEKDDEKTVGEFSGYKAASSITTFQHAVTQWLFFSKRKEINPSNGWNIDGWVINVFGEKNKVASSRHEIAVIFDKRYGIDKFWSEMMFIAEYTPSESKLIRDGAKPFMQLCLVTEGAYSRLKIVDPETDEVIYQSEKGFYKKDAKKLYETNEEFKKWFDYAVDFSCKHRIIKGLLRVDDDTMRRIEQVDNQTDEIVLNEDMLVLDDSIEQDKSISEPDETPKKPGRKKKSAYADGEFDFNSIGLKDTQVIQG